ncbi:MAG: hypothetical protein M0T74_14440 [Desulfitobacterium hafniense]|nr:hypothetical protein [Desulfitobacterium hafniense]
MKKKYLLATFLAINLFFVTSVFPAFGITNKSFKVNPDKAKYKTNLSTGKKKTEITLPFPAVKGGTDITVKYKAEKIIGALKQELPKHGDNDELDVIVSLYHNTSEENFKNKLNKLFGKNKITNKLRYNTLQFRATKKEILLLSKEDDVQFLSSPKDENSAFVEATKNDPVIAVNAATEMTGATKARFTVDT